MREPDPGPPPKPGSAREDLETGWRGRRPHPAERPRDTAGRARLLSFAQPSATHRPANTAWSLFYVNQWRWPGAGLGNGALTSGQKFPDLLTQKESED